MKTVIGALLAITSLVGCSSTSYYADKTINTYDSYRPVRTVIGAVYNFGRASAYSVPEESRLEHEKCVYMVLDNGQSGESCTWQTLQAHGIVRIVRIRPNLCHDLLSTVHYKNKQSSWQDIACPDRKDNWIFYDR